MTRDIKFRAWDEKEKCWVSGFSIHQSGMFSDWAGCKQVNGMCIADANWQYSNEIPHIKIMQYTGLKDKNGKEIYEGDVVEVTEMPNSPDERHYVAEIIYKDACFLIKESGKIEIPLREITYEPYSNGYHPLTCSVIGNKYENPELIA